MKFFRVQLLNVFLRVKSVFVAGGQSSSSSSKKDNDLQPLKSGTLADLDEEMDRTEDSNQTGKVPGSESTNAVFLRIALDDQRFLKFVMF